MLKNKRINIPWNALPIPFNRFMRSFVGKGIAVFFGPRTSLLCVFLPLMILLVGSLPAEAQRASRKKDAAIASVKNNHFNPVEEGLVIEGMKHMMREEADRALPFFEELVGMAPQNATAHYLLATALLKLNRPEGHESALRAYQLDPKNVYFGKFYAESLVRQKKYKEAAIVFEEILAENPGDLQNNLELAAVYVFTDQFDKAIETYNRLEKNIGITEEVSKQKQQLYLRLNKLDEALAEAQKLIDSEPGESYYYVDLAELYIANERMDEAEPILREALKINPNEAQANILLADIYRRRGQLDKCNQELKNVFINPNFDVTPKIRVMSGYLAMLKAEDDRKDAMELVKLLIETHPTEAKPYILYADLLVQTNEKEKARDAYAQAARIDGSIYEIWEALLQLDGELNQYDSLLVHSESALEYFPNQGILWYSNGSANLIRRNYAEAVSSLEESKRLIGNNPILLRYIHAQLGDAYNGMEEYESSEKAYEYVLREDPDNAHVLNNYAYFLSLRKTNLDKAKEMSTRLIEKHPDNATYLDTHAWVLYMLEDYEGAKKYLEKAIQSQSNVSATILEHYGDVLSKLGEKERAIEQWKKARDMGQASDTIDKKIASGIVHD